MPHYAIIRSPMTSSDAETDSKPIIIIIIIIIIISHCYPIGGPRARPSPRTALKWPPEAYKKLDKFAMTTPENTDVFIYVSESKFVRRTQSDGYKLLYIVYA